MRNHNFSVLFYVILTLGLYSNSARSDQIRIELPELQGAYDYYTNPPDTSNRSPAICLQYLNEKYTDISDVYLELTGTYTYGLSRVETFTPLGDTQYSDHVWEGMIYADFIPLENVVSMFRGGARYYPTIEGDFQATVPFMPPHSYSEIDWQELLNSQANNLHLSCGTATFSGAPVFSPKFNLTNVAIVFNATPVPEPSSISLFLCGITGIIVISKRFRS
jgi:hypothetical protein